MLDVLSDKRDTEEKDLISKNIITGKGSTFNRDENVEETSVKVKAEPVDINKTYKIGSILAKAFYDFNESKKRDTYKETTKIATKSQPKTLERVGITTKEVEKKGAGDGLLGKLSMFRNLRNLFKGVKIAERAFQAVKLFGKGISRSRNAGRTGQAIARTLAGARKVLGKTSAGGRAITKLSRIIGKAPRAVTAVRGGAFRAVGGVAAKVKGAAQAIKGPTKGAQIAAAASKFAGPGTKMASVLGAGKLVGGVVGKAAAPLALAVDGITAVTKLSTQKGRDNLRAQAEQLNYQKNFFGTLSKAVLSPLETASAIGLLTKDMLSSTMAAKKSEKNLQSQLAEKGMSSTEELYAKKLADALSKYDANKDGKIDKSEQLRKELDSSFERQKSGRGYKDSSGENWKYDSRKDRLTSDSGRALTREEFISLQYPPKAEPKVEKPVQITVNSPPSIQPKVAPMIPPKRVVSKVDMPSIKTPAPIVDVNLDDQNSLIKQQTNVMLAILDVSKKQLVAKGGEASSAPPIINVSPQQPTRENVTFTNGRDIYLSSPYSLT